MKQHWFRKRIWWFWSEYISTGFNMCLLKICLYPAPLTYLNRDGHFDIFIGLIRENLYA